jgi:glycosyltransferase involved in cell wall biosynthesis
MITYNHGLYIKDAILGVLAQTTNFDIELIVADDCSTDKTEAVVQEIIITHPKSNIIRYNRHSVNKGMMSNFIWSLEQCKGEYIALCEGDDYWIDPYKLQKQINFLEINGEYDLIATNAILDKGHNDRVRVHESVHKNFSFGFNQQINSNCCITCTTMFRKDKISAIKNDLFSSLKIGDIILWAMLLRNNKFGYFLNEDTSSYRIHSGGIYSLIDRKEQILNELEVYETLLKSGCFNKSELKVIQFKVQKMSYSIFCNETFLPRNVSLRKIVENNNILNVNSLLLTFKSIFKFFIKYN